jgi:hypothetical protein
VRLGVVFGRLRGAMPAWCRRPSQGPAPAAVDRWTRGLVYGMGAIGAYWTVDRVITMLTG